MTGTYFDKKFVFEQLIEINDHGLKMSIREVFEHISQIKSSSKYGPDGVPSILFKNCVFTISFPLILLFQPSLYYSHFQNWLVNGIELIIAEECVTNVLLKRFLTSLCLNNCSVCHPALFLKNNMVSIKIGRLCQTQQNTIAFLIMLLSINLTSFLSDRQQQVRTDLICKIKIYPDRNEQVECNSVR